MPFSCPSIRKFHDRGHAILAMNHRRAGNGKGWPRDFYHAGSTGDMAAALGYGHVAGGSGSQLAPPGHRVQPGLRPLLRQLPPAGAAGPGGVGAHAARTIRAMDLLFTAGMAGIPDRDTNYAQCFPSAGDERGWTAIRFVQGLCLFSANLGYLGVLGDKPFPCCWYELTKRVSRTRKTLIAEKPCCCATPGAM